MVDWLMSRSRRFRSRADLSRNDPPLSHRDWLRSPPPGLRHDLPIPDDLWVRVCRVPRAFSLCVSARWHGWGDGVAAVALVGLVPSVLSGGASASALRLSIGSGADSWRNGSGALRPCVRADSARLRCAFFERRPMGIRKSVCNDGRNSSAWSVGPGTIEVRMNWGARGRSGWLPCALAQPTACEHTVGTARGAEHKKGSSALQYDWGRPGTAAVCVHTVGSTVSGLVKVS